MPQLIGWRGGGVGRQSDLPKGAAIEVEQAPALEA